jgi:hypothetical protein
MPDQVIVHDQLSRWLQDILGYYGVDQFNSWFDTHGQKLVGVQQEWVYGSAGLVLMELALPFTTSLASHDLHDTYLEWMNNPGEASRVNVKRMGKRVYSSQNSNGQYGSWLAHRALSSLSSVPTLKHWAIQGIAAATNNISTIYEGVPANYEKGSHTYQLLPTTGNSRLEGYLDKEFGKIESEEMQLKIYPYLLVMQQFEQI